MVAIYSCIICTFKCGCIHNIILYYIYIGNIWKCIYITCAFIVIRTLLQPCCLAACNMIYAHVCMIVIVYIYIYRFARRWMDLSETGDTPNSWPSWWGKFTTLPHKISMPRVASDNANRMLKYSNLWLPTSWLMNITMEIHVSHSDLFLLFQSISWIFHIFFYVFWSSFCVHGLPWHLPELSISALWPLWRPTAAQPPIRWRCVDLLRILWCNSWNWYWSLVWPLSRHMCVYIYSMYIYNYIYIYTTYIRSPIGLWLPC